jgi:hypothetical protein
MNHTLQTLTAVIALIFTLSVIVQALQEFIKNLLGTKASAMEDTINQYMGSALQLPDVKKALTVRGLDLTALEHFNTTDFRQLLDAIPFQQQQLQGIVASTTATVDEIKNNIAASYEAARASFQKIYTKRNKIIALLLSVVVVGLLNANVIILYQSISADEAAQQAIVNKVQTLVADQGKSSGDAAADAQTLANTYQAKRKDIVNALQQEPILMRTGRYGEDFNDGWAKELFGLLFMAALVSLGAPFWNDVLKGATGVNNALNSGGKKS